MKAILTVGVSASGKTTWAEEFVRLQNSVTSESDPEDFPRWFNINRDDIRFSLLGVRDWKKWDWKKEGQVTHLQEKMLKECAAKGWNVIYSDTNLNERFREELISKLESLNYDVEIKTFPISFEEAVDRDSSRANGVGYSVIAKQMEQWHKFVGTEQHEHNLKLPTCVIVDIDGTLAHMQDRTAFEWEKVGEDSLDICVNSLVHAFVERGYRVFLFSGRDEVCRNHTEKWLDNFKVPYDLLAMRREGDMRKDVTVKKEMFDKHIKGKYNVFCAVDDRPVCIRLWQSMGIKTLAVGNPYIEF